MFAKGSDLLEPRVRSAESADKYLRIVTGRSGWFRVNKSSRGASGKTGKMEKGKKLKRDTEGNGQADAERPIGNEWVNTMHSRATREVVAPVVDRSFHLRIAERDVSMRLAAPLKEEGFHSALASARARARAIPFEELAAAARVQGSILSFTYSKSPRDGRAKHAREAEVKVSPFSLLPSGEVSFVFAFGEDSRRILWPRKIARRGNLETPASFSLSSHGYFVYFVSLILPSCVYPPVHPP